MDVHLKTGRLALHWQMLIGFLLGLGAGLSVYLTAQDAAWVETVSDVTGFIGQVFLRLLFMLVIPLLFSALVVGIAEMGDARSLKRTGLRTLAFTVIVSGIAVVLALTVANVFQPGAGVDRQIAETLLADARDNAGAIISRNAETPSGLDALLAIIPSNVFAAMSANDILAVMFFALFFGIGLLFADSPQAEVLQKGIEGVFHVTMKLIMWVIRLAPIAIACFMFNLASAFGWDILIRLGAYVLVVLLALGLHMFVVYPLVLRFWAGVSPLWFFRNVREAMLIAFSTASSNATLPYALKVADENLELPRAPARFVLTIGATANQNGTAIFEGITVLFLAQFFGVDLGIGEQLVVLLMCILGGIGTAGVPAGSLPVVALILAMVGVPPEGIGIVLGVDRLLDMCRTTLNVTGDLAAATVVSKGHVDDAELSDLQAA
ncbi:dicarboxylate/amino acid:cation symporter [Sphingomicrobium astaxanthinifaciens]|uniref:dicarboxylate/amino acid:cation symporter n=1 Tax=Sphingomicrobium astaxanthinifaciens TaxID=1227949 RepID=UPI001FCA77DF|nr:dicarboxylate/amino acid:cation symporter [Sphingomicrobium astaxanthinifaciens]MCJ7422243.1 dicarboxylate/amino acid:cation symporter [Sphingomicrobium astaxanthinifaciens]